MHGLSRQELESRRQPHEWSIVPALNRWSLAKAGTAFDDHLMWYWINVIGIDFWTQLDRLPWFDDVIRCVEKFTTEWYVLSAPSLDPTCQLGKIHWLQENIGQGFDRYLLTPHKYLLAKPGTFLIDDRAENVAKFLGAGGDGCLFPSHGNILRGSADNPVPFIEEQLSLYSKKG